MDAADGSGAQGTIAGKPGLQAERTDLSWTRSGLAFLVNGTLLLMHHELAAPSALHLAAGCAAFALALFTAVMAYRRRRILAIRPLPEALAAPIALLLLGFGTALLGVVTLVVLLLG